MGRVLRFDKLDPVAFFKRWRTSRIELLRQLDGLKRENEQLRNKLAHLQHAKEQAERSLEERRREKKALRDSLNFQKKSSETQERVTEQLSTKLAELREENERLLRREKTGG